MVIPRRLHWPPPWPDRQGEVPSDMPPAELRQVLVIASTPRVASTFFVAALTATQLAGRPTEFLNPEALAISRRQTGVPRLTARGRALCLKRRLAGDPRWEQVGALDPNSLADYLRDIAGRRSTANGVFAVKVHSGQLRLVLERNGLGVDVWGVPVRWVRLRRRDRLAQAVSFVVAHQTGQWLPAAPQKSEPWYDLLAIQDAMTSIERWEAVWDQRLAERPEPMLSFWSEDLVSDTAAAVSETLALLGEAPMADVGTPPTEQYRNPDRQLRGRWIERAMAESPDLVERRWAPGGAVSQEAG
jgi:LPS sulfotransferase NodH